MQLPSNRRGDLQAVHLGKMKIQQRHVVLIVQQSLEGLLAIGGDVDMMTALREQQLQDLMGGRAVFRDQDPAAGNGV